MEAKEFLAEFKRFCEELRDAGIEAKEEQAINLLAIYRKDLRANNMNNDKARQGARPATQRQKKLIQNLASEKGVRISQEEIDGLSKKQTSRLIDRLGGHPPGLSLVMMAGSKRASILRME